MLMVDLLWFLIIFCLSSGSWLAYIYLRIQGTYNRVTKDIERKRLHNIVLMKC